MAQKQYSFDFVLNAVLNGGFSGVFTKAQQEFIRLGGEIKNLEAIQRDIAAYQKQAAAVENTSGKLENLRRQYELVNRQISETTGSTAALEREKLKLEQRISNTEAALEKQRAKLEDTKERLDAAGVSTGNLSQKNAELTERIKELTEEQKKAAEGAVGFGDKSAAAIEAVGSAIATAGIAEAVKGITDAYTECVGVAGDFEQAMSAVEAIAEANTSEMKALTAEAKELGASTIYTAQQSAKSMEYMAMAGWEAQEMLAGMAGVTNLAAAAGEDLAQVSDIVTDNLSAFKLQASDTAHFADVLAAAAANSNTNIAIMGETFKNSSSVAGALGYSIEDVAVMVGLMANNAVKGSRAATALRNIFDGLLGGVTLTAKAFGELEYSAVNYDGSMKGLIETTKDLRGYFDQMTESEKVLNAQNIAGMRGYNGLLAILNATDEDFQSLYDSIHNCTGAAQRMAAVKLDNLNGDITLMNSAMEALQNTIGEQFNLELRELTQLKTELLNGINIFVQENPALVKGIMAGGAAFLGLGTAIVGVNAAMKIFQTLNMASLFVSAGPLLGGVAAIAGLAAAVVGLTAAYGDGAVSARKLTGAARETREAIEETGNAYEQTASQTIAAARVAESYIDRLEELGEGTEASDEHSREYLNTLSLLCSAVPELTEYINLETGAIEGGTEALRENTEEWKKNSEEKARQDYINGLMNQYNDVADEAAENSIKLTEAEIRLERIEKDRESALSRLNKLRGKGTVLAEEEEAECYRLQNALNDYNKEALEAANEAEAYARAVEKDNEALDEAAAALDSATEAYERYTGATEDQTEAEKEAARQSAELNGALESTRMRLQELADEYETVYELAKKSFEGQFGMFDEAKKDTDATVSNAQKALDSQLKYWKDYAANIEFLKGKTAEDLKITKEDYKALMAYIEDGSPEIAGLLDDAVKKIKAGKDEAVGKLAETAREVAEYRDQAAQEWSDWTLGLTEQMDELIHDMKEDIDELDLSEEARNYGVLTMQSYISAADDMLPQVQAAYSKLAKAAANALYVPIDGVHAAPSAYDLAKTARYNFMNGSYFTWNGFASGTDNAPPGWSWVGEEGPELMRLHGGEQILPAKASRRLAEDYRVYNNYVAAQGVQPTRALEVAQIGTSATAGTKVEVHVHVEAGAVPETVDAWQDYARRGELKAVVLEVMEDAEADARRRALT